MGSYDTPKFESKRMCFKWCCMTPQTLESLCSCSLSLTRMRWVSASCSCSWHKSWMSCIAGADSGDSSTDAQVDSHESTSGEIFTMADKRYVARSPIRNRPHPITQQATIKYTLCVCVYACVRVRVCQCVLCVMHVT